MSEEGHATVEQNAPVSQPETIRQKSPESRGSSRDKSPSRKRDKSPGKHLSKSIKNYVKAEIALFNHRPFTKASIVFLLDRVRKLCKYTDFREAVVQQLHNFPASELQDFHGFWARSIAAWYQDPTRPDSSQVELDYSKFSLEQLLAFGNLTDITRLIIEQGKTKDVLAFLYSGIKKPVLEGMVCVSEVTPVVTATSLPQ